MKQTLQVRLSQHLALTPQLQQSIRLLQLSTLELHQEVEQMLASNPLLETEEEFTVSTPELASNAPAESGTEASAGESESGDAPELNAEDFGGTEREDWENGTERDDFDGIRELPSSAGSGSGDEDGERESQESAETTLAEHLAQQLAGLHLSPEDRAAVQVLIESLNEDGYLEDPLEEIAAALAEDAEDREELLDSLRIALRLLQSLEPAGIGAGSLSECLVLQLRALPAAQCGPAQAVAVRICGSHLELLARRDMRRLMNETGADEALLREAQALITRLEPKPGRRFAQGAAAAIVPDVIVRKVGRELRVMLNPEVAPKLRINELYANALRATRGGISNSPLGGQLQEARWFIKNIQQRFDTILRVSQAIVERQRGFFTHGELAMKPLVLREIADELGLHESTISRVTTAKYMATAWGTFELKYFFGSGLSTEAGGEASSTAVRALIKQFVAAEDVKKPLSDSALAGMLEEQGIQCARRTVAKYREGMKIAPANLRKAL
ncbi:RNA polymerase factor sigma-54 [Roseateles saccharophilus]|uniref:RNA polymerase sigma-54 factor n=1 Tax=Roseateles saccharophilus TaxID=304 RepID=A0A4R3VIZ3_ROSSA|nr:RNA polymerase factor sigma-54 [Roseateles saccharophilus]MDG0831230.1 RNA polymerase factor sigma-54 [Roseateles saccharophilus]TCV04351.1 RNA polymerase RpoN-/SigL-like sigma 54 subunit [Roseateles saccharophilus]